MAESSLLLCFPSLLRCDGDIRCRDAARHGSVRLQPDHRLQMTSRMTVRHVVGAALVVIGLVSLLWGGFRWTENKTVVDIGPVKATAEEHKTLPIPPVVGALLLVGGIVVLVVPTRRRIR
ncbi:MAG: hypothetical protein DMF87_23705 [Acidobacteria bacterium]|nr:MAG: hypothetical protein DMF87_23705 [Acidobacteriota bacterium]